jgi:hypothetical protein
MDFHYLSFKIWNIICDSAILSNTNNVCLERNFIVSQVLNVAEYATWANKMKVPPLEDCLFIFL